MHALLSSADFIFSNKLFIFFFRNTIGVSNILDTDQTRRSVGSDLGPNCLPMLSADDTSRQRSEIFVLILLFIFPGSMVLLRTQLQPYKLFTEIVLINDNECLVLWVGLWYAALVFPVFYISWFCGTFRAQTCNCFSIDLHCSFYVGCGPHNSSITMRLP